MMTLKCFKYSFRSSLPLDLVPSSLQFAFFGERRASEFEVKYIPSVNNNNDRSFEARRVNM